MKITKELFERAKQLCVDKGKICSRDQLAKELNLNTYAATHLWILLRHAHILEKETLKIQHDETESIRIGVCGDLHVGSSSCQEDYIVDFFEFLNREGVNILMITGDIIDGVGVYRGQEFELQIVRVDEQVKVAAELLKVFKGEIYFIIGNHEYSTVKKVGIDVGSLLSSETCKYVGAIRGRVEIANITFELWHGRGASAYALSYKLQKAIEQYNSTNRPRFLLAGHWHTAVYIPTYRDVDGFLTGCFQTDTILTKQMGVGPQLGGWLIEIHHEGGKVISVDAVFRRY